MIYVTDNVAARVLVKTAAASSTVTLDFSGTKSDYSGMQVVYPSKKVPKGEVYHSEDRHTSSTKKVRRGERPWVFT